MILELENKSLGMVLQTLTLNGNKLENLHGDGLKGLGSLKTLNLRHCDLTTIPSDLFSNSRIIQTLDVGYNRIFSLPPSKDLKLMEPTVLQV
jgi:Leucine-rich repeat (LRR) protein